jgi:hypothetical protein
LFIDQEDGRDTFLRNIGWSPTECSDLYATRLRTVFGDFRQSSLSRFNLLCVKNSKGKPKSKHIYTSCLWHMYPTKWGMFSYFQFFHSFGKRMKYGISNILRLLTNSVHNETGCSYELFSRTMIYIVILKRTYNQPLPKWCLL